MYKSLIVFVFIVIGSNAYSQRTDFIATDSTINSGVKLIKATPQKNARFIRVRDNKGTLNYTPEDLQSYGFKNGQVFESHTLTMNGVQQNWFLRRVFKGKHSIYFLPVDKQKKLFILPHDSLPMQEIPKQGLKEFLTKYVDDCEKSKINVRHVKLNENSIGRFFRDYQGCSSSSLPRVRYGFFAGLNVTGLSSNDADAVTSIPEYDQMVGFQVGFRVISPIGRSNFAFVTGPVFQNFKSSHEFEDNNRAYDLVINQSRLNLPLMLRYTFHKLKSNPFIELGPGYSKFLYGRNTLYSYETIDDNILIDIDENSAAIAEDQVGFSAHAGAIINYDANLSISCKIGFKKWYAVNSSESLTVNQIALTLELLF